MVIVHNYVSLPDGNIDLGKTISGWWLCPTPLRNHGIRQLGRWHFQWKKNVPNHQPDVDRWFAYYWCWFSIANYVTLLLKTAVKTGSSRHLNHFLGWIHCDLLLHRADLPATATPEFSPCEAKIQQKSGEFHGDFMVVWWFHGDFNGISWDFHGTSWWFIWIFAGTRMGILVFCGMNQKRFLGDPISE